jgi:hypothetical protein
MPDVFFFGCKTSSKTKQQQHANFILFIFCKTILRDNLMACKTVFPLNQLAEIGLMVVPRKSLLQDL